MAEELSPESKLYVKQEIDQVRREMRQETEKAKAKAVRTFTTFAVVLGLLTGAGVYGLAVKYIDAVIRDAVTAEGIAKLKSKAENLVKGITELNSSADDLVDVAKDRVKRIHEHEAQAKQSASDIGNIKSEAGQILPSIVVVGTIVPYGGTVKDNPPGQPHEVHRGWLFCNGAALDRKEYQALYKVVGVAFGAPDRDRFNLPDLRGRFVRGVDHGAGRDPNAKDRTVSNKGGNKADNVGSLQPDALMHHSHPLEKPIYEHYRSFAGWAGTDLPLKSSRAYKGDKEWTVKTAETGGQETRPKNIYVNWIIKAQ